MILETDVLSLTIEAPDVLLLTIEPVEAQVLDLTINPVVLQVDAGQDQDLNLLYQISKL